MQWELFADLPPEEVRRVEVPDALVDTGATFLSMPRRYIQQLGLQLFRTRQAKTSSGVATFGMEFIGRR